MRSLRVFYTEEYTIILPSTFKNKEIDGKIARVYIDHCDAIKDGEAVFMRNPFYGKSPFMQPEIKLEQPEFRRELYGRWMPDERDRNE
jgi:hypothetical protein